MGDEADVLVCVRSGVKVLAHEQLFMPYGTTILTLYTTIVSERGLDDKYDLVEAKAIHTE